jgi:hypothetical protein
VGASQIVRWCSFTTTTGGGAPRLGAVVARDGRRPGPRRRRLGAQPLRDAPQDLVDLVEASPAGQERVTDLVRSAPQDGTGWVRLEEVVFAAPVRAPELPARLPRLPRPRRAGRGPSRLAGAGGVGPDPGLLQGNRRSIVGPDEVVRWPSYTEKLDYECEIAAWSGAPGATSRPRTRGRTSSATRS